MHNTYPSTLETNLLAQMGQIYFSMIQRLNEFSFDHHDFKMTMEADDHEMLITNRFIKKEVIDTADLVE